MIVIMFIVQATAFTSQQLSIYDDNNIYRTCHWFRPASLSLSMPRHSYEENFVNVNKP
jgi:hypothetical protein